MICSGSSDVQDRLVHINKATIRAYGQLFCDKKPASGITVKLMEFEKVQANQELETTTSDENGYFNIFGKDGEISFSDTIDGQKRETLYLIPKESQNGIYDLSFIDLEERPADNCRVKISLQPLLK
ncbi:transthyretin-like family domain-containing protein [Ditylenchus destructor]|uniref:Transthyretin-like family domain-containing protein n=1 Tax=Ditylenchus destructor TaxID=166010 RepID=A0AAD4MWG6_9BILA|nr:transthyretin-like family domain-containing protein [Ditylenchus destructor]